MKDPFGTSLRILLPIILISVCGFPSDTPEAIQTFDLPALECGMAGMTGDGSALFLLDSCGTIRQWNPTSGESQVVVLENPPQGIGRFAVGKSRMAVHVGEAQEIWVYDRSGKLLKRHVYDGDSVVRGLAVLGNYVAATTWFDDHLLFLFDDPEKPPKRLIKNPQYWPDAAPRYRSETDIIADGDQFIVIDRVNYVVHTVNPSSGVVKSAEKDRYPGAPKIEKPTEKWGESDGNDRYTGMLYATSSTAANGEAFLVMLDRRVVDESGYDNYYLEIAASNSSGAAAWKRRAVLADKYRFAGSQFPTIIGDTLYVYMHKDGVVHAVPIGL